MTYARHDERADPASTAAEGDERWTVVSAVLAVLFVLAAVATGLAWALASSVGASPDDDYHLTSIWCAAGDQPGRCEIVRDEQGTLIGARAPENVTNSAVCFAFKPDVSGSCGSLLSDDLVLYPREDFGQLYPGPYYRAMHALVTDDEVASVLRMRLANVVVAVALFTAVALLARADGRRLLTMAVLGSIVPLGLFVLASVNPSSWALSGVTTAWLALHVVLTARGRAVVVAATLLYVVAAAVAAVSRGDAAAYVLVVTVAVVVANAERVRRHPARLAVPLLVGIGAAASFLQAGQTRVLDSGFPGGQGRELSVVLFQNIIQMPALVTGVLGVGPRGALGWLDTTMPALTYVPTLVVAGGLLLVGLSVMSWRKLLALAVVGGTIIFLPLYINLVSLNFVGDNVQPRYLLPLVPALLGVALMSRPSARTLRLAPGQVVMVYVLLVAAQSAALHATLRRFVTGQDVVSARFSYVEWWWPWSWVPSPMVVWVGGSAAFAVLCLSLAVVQGRRPGDLAGFPPEGAGVAGVRR